MYAVIVIEARISHEERMNWIGSYLIGFVTSQIVSPLLKALIDCLSIILICKIDFGETFENF